MSAPPPTFLSALGQVISSSTTVDKIMDALPFNLIIDRAEGGCIYANSTQLRSFNLSWEEFRGYGWARLVHPGDVPLFQKTANDFLNGKEERFELKYRVCVPPGGEVRWIHAYVLAIRDVAGAYLGNVGVSFDVTAQQESRQDHAYAQKMEAVGRLSGRVAHDFNNLLGVLLACLYMVEHAPASAPAQHATMLDTVERARQLTDQLLRLARTGSDRRFCCLDEELKRLTPLVVRTIGQQIAFVATLDAGQSMVALDDGQLSQIALNLLVNARDAIANGGNISFRTQATDTGVRWTVEDDGSGMSPEVAARAVEPFYSTKPESQGTGLGLSTVADLVREAGGSLAIDSAPGRGTRIVIELPVVQRPPAKVPAARTGALPRTDNRTLLLLEDHDSLRQSLALALSTHGYRVVSTGSVQEALYLAANEPELAAVVTDMHLTDGLGIDYMAELRKTRPLLPAIYMSGLPEAAPRSLASHEGFLPKPVAPRDLLDALATLLS